MDIGLKLSAVTLLNAVAKPQKIAHANMTSIMRDRASRARGPLPTHTPTSARVMTVAIVRSTQPIVLTSDKAVSVLMDMPKTEDKDLVIRFANATFPLTAHPPCPAKLNIFASAANTYKINKLLSLNIRRSIK